MALDHSLILCLARSKGHLLHNLAERLAFPRKEQPLPHVLNEADIAQLIETPDTTTAIGLRDRALMETLYATGIRHSEAHKLDLYDVDVAAFRLTVRLGKGQRDRVVPLTETAAYWLARYLTASRPELAAGLWWGKGRRRGQRKLVAPTSALWLSVTGRRLSYQMIAERIRDYAVQAEVKASVHTFATAAQRIYCVVAPAFVTCNNSSGTAISTPLRSTRTSNLRT